MARSLALAEAETRLRDVEAAYQEEQREQGRLRGNLKAVSRTGQLADAVRQYQQELARYDARIIERVQERNALRKDIEELKERVRRATDAMQA